MKRAREEDESENNQSEKRRRKEQSKSGFEIALLLAHAPRTEFPTHLLTNFADTGKIPVKLDDEKEQEIIEKIKLVITDQEFQKRAQDYEAHLSGNKRKRAERLALDTFNEFVQHYKDIDESIKKRVRELFNQEQARALRVTAGSLSVLFTAVGHGDCTVIRTPAGKTIVIDCGSSGGIDPNSGRESESEDLEMKMARHQIEVLLGWSNCLDFLILTHPDKDHYNKLETIFAEKVIGKIYHSATFSKYGNQTWYIERMCSNAEKGGASTAKSLINQVSFCYSSKLGKSDKPPFKTEMKDLNNNSLQPGNYDRRSPDNLDSLDEDAGLLIWAEANCRISILSSNVYQEHKKDSSTAENRGSVVVLIKSFGKKILICGDATFNTEKELITRYGDKIANIDVLRVGHHGSGCTSSQEEFISHVKAKRAWISESRKSAYHSPSFEVIKRLWEHADAGAAPHDLYFWSGLQHYQLSECAAKTLEGSGGTLTFTPELIASYSEKHVYLTAASPNGLIEFTSTPSGLRAWLHGLIEFISTPSGTVCSIQ